MRNSVGNAPESIHLCDFPVVDESQIDESLMNKVDALRKVVEQSRSARNKANLKIRQPLGKLCYAVEDDEIAAFIEENGKVILEELNVKALERVSEVTDLIQYEMKPNLPYLGENFGDQMKDIRNAISTLDVDQVVSSIKTDGYISIPLNDEDLKLGKEAFLITTVSHDGFTSEMDGGIAVGLTTEITEELRREGMVRDLIRNVQIMRKNANFAVEDRIKIGGLIDGKMGDALNDYKDFFYNETLTVEMKEDLENSEHESSFEIHGQTITLNITRAHTSKG